MTNTTQLESNTRKDFLNAKGKFAGFLKDNVFRKKVDSKKHQMRMFGGSYGVDTAIVLQLNELGCREVRILETDTDRVLTTSFDNFIVNGIEKDFENKQTFLPIKFFLIADKNQQSLNFQTNEYPLE